MLSIEQKDFVRGPRIAVLATVGPDGEPYAFPVWYFFDGSRFLTVTRRGTPKHLHLDGHPGATIVVDHRDRRYYGLAIGCTAEIDDHDADLARSRIAPRYLTEPQLTSYLESERGSDAVVIRLQPTSVAVYGTSPPG